MSLIFFFFLAVVECRIALFQMCCGVCWANVFVVTVSASIVRLGQDFWQVFHGADAAHFKQHGGEAGWGSTQEVHLVRNFILRQVVGNCRYVQAGGGTQVSYSIFKTNYFMLWAYLAVCFVPTEFEDSAVLESQTLLGDALKISYLLRLPLNCWIIYTLSS